jgi:hypothetical protein
MVCPIRNGHFGRFVEPELYNGIARELVQLSKKRLAIAVVIFSPEGLAAAQREYGAIGNFYLGAHVQTYMGCPFKVDPNQKEPFTIGFKQRRRKAAYLAIDGGLS